MVQATPSLELVKTSDLPNTTWRRAASVVAALALSECGGGGAGDTQATPTHTLSVRIGSVMATGESFSLGSQTISVTATGTATAFAQPVAEGGAYTVNQGAIRRALGLATDALLARLRKW